MENSNPAPQPSYCQCSHYRRHGGGFFGGLFRFIGVLVVLALVFAAGCAVGGSGPRFMMRSAFHGTPDGFEFGAGKMLALNGGPGTFNVKFGPGGSQFGVVTAITDQKITIADNGGGTKTVLVDSATIVQDGAKEVPVWNLRRGFSVRVHGITEESVIKAKLIEVVR